MTKRKLCGELTMTDKDELLSMINMLLERRCSVDGFCEAFVLKYALNTDYSKLIDEEKAAFSDLFSKAKRYSPYVEDLRIPNMYYSDDEIIEEAQKCRQSLAAI